MKRTAFSPHDSLYIQRLKTVQKHDMSVQHYHDAYEIYLQLDGKRYLFYDNICYTLERGSLAVINPFDIHYAESRESDSYERYVLNFQAEGLSVILKAEEKRMLLDKFHSCIINLTEEQIKAVLGLFERIESYTGQKGFFSQHVLYSAVLQLLVYVAECIDAQEQLQGNTIAPPVMAALKYISAHYQENITLDSISEIVYVSKYYFCRSFHEATGATFLEYLNNVRLTKVHSLLVDTNMKIEKIAEQTGFPSPVSLTRAFKKVYGVTPREFRKNKA